MHISKDKIAIDPLYNQISETYRQLSIFEDILVTQNEHIEIEGSIHLFGKQIKSTIQLDKDENLISYSCNCDFPHHAPCPHVLALIDKVNTLDISSLPFHYLADIVGSFHKFKQESENRREKAHLMEITLDGRNMIDYYKLAYQSKLEQVINNEKIEIDALLEYNYGYELSFKVGKNKKYIIKNISQFLSMVEHQQFHSYGKQLEMIHKIENFDENAQKQIEFMKATERIQQNYSEYTEMGRHIGLTLQNIDEFFSCYEDMEGMNFSCESIDKKIKLHWSEKQYVNELSLDEKIDAYNFGKKNLYQLTVTGKNYLIQKISLDDDGKAIALLNKLKKQPIKILKSESNDFYKYVLWELLDYFDIANLNIGNESQSVAIKVFGDINEEGNVTIKVEYINDEQKSSSGFEEQDLLNYEQDLVESVIKKYASRIENKEAILESNADSTITFLEDGIPLIRQYADIYISDALKRFNEKKKYHINVGVKYEGDLLSLNIQSDDLPKNEISSILSQYRKKKKFYRLKSGELIHLDSPVFDELSQMMDNYHLSSKDLDEQIKLDPYRMFSLENDAQNFKEIEFDRKQSFTTALDSFDVKAMDKIKISKKYEKILRDYQKYGVRWMKLLSNYGFNGILADDMGLGKTLQVIALLEEEKGQGASMIVVPSSLVYNWKDEFEKFSSQLKATCIVGNLENRKKWLEEKSDIYITSYDYMRRDEELYQERTFNYVILDEAQYIKNQKTQNAISVKKLKSKKRLALTGTPIENSLAELWSIFDFLMPGYLFNYHYFLHHYEMDIVKNDDEDKKKRLKKLVEPFILRRNKKEVLQELPEKIEKTLTIDFNDEEKDLYLAHLASVNLELNQMMGNQQVDKIAILAMMTKLRQICCEPRLLFDNIYHSSSKMKACMDLVVNLKENNQKVLIFSSFTSVLDLIAQELNYLNISYFKLTGQTSKEDRRNLIAQFQSDDTEVFLISLKAGGTGLNLTAASAVIHFDPWWNVSAQNQATDRTYRIGQQNNVQVFKLVMKNSIEEKILKLQEKKKNLADNFVENNEGSISKMDKNDLLELFQL